MVRPRSDVPEESTRYGLGFWLHATGDGCMLEGYDAGVSFRSVHDPGTATVHRHLQHLHGAWPVTRRLDELLGTGVRSRAGFGITTVTAASGGCVTLLPSVAGRRGGGAA